MRLNPYTCSLSDKYDIKLFASEDVAIDRASVAEIEEFSKIHDVLENLNAAGYLDNAHIGRIAITPDFHRGSAIPVGTVFDAYGFTLPKAVGKDIGCGMRLLTTDLSEAAFNGIERLDDTLRHIFFEGGRDIALDANTRDGIFRHGLHAFDGGIGAGKGYEMIGHTDYLRDVMHAHNLGCFRTDNVMKEFHEFIHGHGCGCTHDDQLGSIGGSNHFVEIQIVDEIFDKQLAYQWGLKKGMCTIMAHSGSVSIGAMVGTKYMDMAKKLYPKIGHPPNEFYPLDMKVSLEYISAMKNAANFAFANRFFLGLMALRGLIQASGKEINASLVHDAPHNLVWDYNGGYLHRKGACPALGGDDIFPNGHPVIIPGSMGSASYVCVGQGNVQSFCSAPHGAGRIKPRQGARHEPLDMLKLRIVGKINPDNLPEHIRKEYWAGMAEEAPSSYKDITPVMDTTEGANLAQKVVRLKPLLTIKG